MPTGIVALPMIFGSSASFQQHLGQFQQFDFLTEAVSLHRQRAPFFLPYVMSQSRLHRLADQMDDELIQGHIAAARDRLRRQGCTQVAIVGFGYGGICALRFATRFQVDAVVTWYPHLVFPAGATKTPPLLSDVTSPALLFYGKKRHRDACFH